MHPAGDLVGTHGIGLREYRSRRPGLVGIIQDSLARLRARGDLVVIEGAGSPAEINLKDGELTTW